MEYAIEGTVLCRVRTFSQHWFILKTPSERSMRGKQEYNKVRPYSALNNIPPALYRTGGDSISDSSQRRSLLF